MDKRYEDDRPRRRDATGLGSGALVGAGVGLLMGLVVPGVGSLVAIGVIGVVGAALGRAVTKSVNLEEWDSSMVQRPFVGVHAPDSDETRT